MTDLNNNHAPKRDHHRVIKSTDGRNIVIEGTFDNGVRYNVARDLEVEGGLALAGIDREGGTQTIRFTNGTSISTDASCIKTVQRANGQKIAFHPNGDQSIKFSDGTELFRRGGATRVVYPDGSQTSFQMQQGRSVPTQEPIPVTHQVAEAYSPGHLSL